jgi:hypothetical protein
VKFIDGVDERTVSRKKAGTYDGKYPKARWYRRLKEQESGMGVEGRGCRAMGW